MLTQGLCKILTEREEGLHKARVRVFTQGLLQKAYLRYLPKACIRVITDGLCKKGL